MMSNVTKWSVFQNPITIILFVSYACLMYKTFPVYIIIVTNLMMIIIKSWSINMYYLQEILFIGLLFESQPCMHFYLRNGYDLMGFPF